MRARARMCRVDLRGEVVNAGGGRHGGGEVAFGGVGNVVGDVVVEGARESGGLVQSECKWGGCYQARGLG